MTWHSTQSHYTDSGPTISAFSMPSANERAANTILKVFGITRPGIEPTSTRTQAGRSRFEGNRPANLNGFYHNWASAWQNQQNDWAPREESDQHEYPHSLISLHCALNGLLRFLSFLWLWKIKNWIVDSENWSDLAAAQADLSLHWVHMSFCWFVGGSYVMRTKVMGPFVAQ